MMLCKKKFCSTCLCLLFSFFRYAKRYCCDLSVFFRLSVGRVWLVLVWLSFEANILASFSCQQTAICFLSWPACFLSFLPSIFGLCSVVFLVKQTNKHSPFLSLPLLPIVPLLLPAPISPSLSIPTYSPPTFLSQCSVFPPPYSSFSIPLSVVQFSARTPLEVPCQKVVQLLASAHTQNPLTCCFRVLDPFFITYARVELFVTWHISVKENFPHVFFSRCDLIGYYRYTEMSETRSLTTFHPTSASSRCTKDGDEEFVFEALVACYRTPGPAWSGASLGRNWMVSKSVVAQGHPRGGGEFGDMLQTSKRISPANHPGVRGHAKKHRN